MGLISFFKRFRESGDARRQNRKRNSVNSVGGRSAEAAGRRKNRAVLAALILIFAALTGTVLWLALQKLAEELLYTNPEYRIRTIEIVSDGSRISREKVKQWTELEIGLNIHDLNIAKIRMNLLRRVPVIKSVEIVRHMPDRIEIRLSERLPIAAVGLLGLRGVDNTGYVFAISPSGTAMPVITGFMEDPTPGTRLQGRMLNAVEVVDVLNRTTLGSLMRVEALDVREADCLVLKLAEGPLIRLKWPDMAMSTPESRLALDGKLRSLARVMDDARLKNRRLSKIDMTFNDDYIPVE